jgi:hypothetical protein
MTVRVIWCRWKVQDTAFLNIGKRFDVVYCIAWCTMVRCAVESEEHSLEPHAMFHFVTRVTALLSADSF